MNSNFEYYKIFYYVAKYENLTKAATALKTSQPAVTRTIHKLEGELGCRLFTRSKTGMKLTPEGRTVLWLCGGRLRPVFQRGERP